MSYKVLNPIENPGKYSVRPQAAQDCLTARTWRYPQNNTNIRHAVVICIDNISRQQRSLGCIVNIPDGGRIRYRILRNLTVCQHITAHRQAITHLIPIGYAG